MVRKVLLCLFISFNAFGMNNDNPVFKAPFSKKRKNCYSNDDEMMKDLNRFRRQKLEALDKELTTIRKHVKGPQGYNIKLRKAFEDSGKIYQSIANDVDIKNRHLYSNLNIKSKLAYLDNSDYFVKTGSLTFLKIADYLNKLKIDSFQQEKCLTNDFKEALLRIDEDFKEIIDEADKKISFVYLDKEPQQKTMSFSDLTGANTRNLYNQENRKALGYSNLVNLTNLVNLLKNRNFYDFGF